MIAARKLRSLPCPIGAVALLLGGAALAADPLPSWNEGPAKEQILAFVAKVTSEGAPSYVPPAERIAVFDNDGTLWPENPAPFQVMFAIDEAQRLTQQNPQLLPSEAIAGMITEESTTSLEEQKRAGRSSASHPHRPDDRRIRRQRGGLAGSSAASSLCSAIR